MHVPAGADCDRDFTSRRNAASCFHLANLSYCFPQRILRQVLCTMRRDSAEEHGHSFPLGIAGLAATPNSPLTISLTVTRSCG